MSWPFTYVTIEFDDRHPGLWGHVRYARLFADHQNGTDPWTVGDLRSWCTAFWGGWAGESVTFEKPGNGSAQDVAEIQNTLKHADLSEGQKQEIATSSLKLAIAIASGAKQSLEELSEALKVRRTLQFQEVDEIIRRSVPPDVIALIDGK